MSLNLFNALAAVLAGKKLPDKVMNSLPEQIGINIRSIADSAELEDSLLTLAAVGQQQGITVVEITGNLKMMNGRSIRCIAILDGKDGEAASHLLRQVQVSTKIN